MIGIKPHLLLGQARDLAGVGAGRGRPRPMDLRRATSAAYYALFHAINRYVAWSALPDTQEEDWLRLTRSIGHQSIRDVSKWVVDGSGPEHLRPLLQICHSDGDMYRVADAFLASQQSRHRADYDHLAPFSKREVIAQIEAAAVAMDLLVGLHPLAPFEIYRSAILLKSTPR